MALGEAQVKIVPDLSAFRSELTQGINDAMRQASRTVDAAGEQIEQTFVEAAQTADRALSQIDGNGMTGATNAARRASDQVEAQLSSAAREADDALAAVDGDDFKEARRQADKAGKDIGDSFDEGAKQGQNALKNFAQSAAFAAAGAAVAKFAKSSIDAFADLGETLSKAEVIFGDATQSIVEFGDRAAESMGQSKQAAIAAASDFAIFGGAAGLTGEQLATFSTDLTMLASDLASFSNTTPEEAVMALGAALRGESEPIRRYGVLLDDATLKARAMEMGIYDGNGALTQQQRVLAANAEIFAQTGLAQGDFARTSDSLANSQKTLAAQFADMQAQVGEALAPAMQMVVDIGSDLLKLFTMLPEEVQTLVTIVGVAGVAFVAASRTLQGLGVAAATANKAMGALGLILTGATLIYASITGAKDKATTATRNLAGALLLEGEAQKDALEELVASDPAMRRFVEAVSSLGLEMADVSEFIKSGTGRLAELQPQIQSVKDEVKGTYPELAALARDILGVTLSSDDLNKAYQDLTPEQKAAAVAVRDFGDQVVRLQGEQESQVGVQELVTDVTDEMTAAQKRAEQTMNEMRQATTMTAEQMAKYQEALSAALDRTNVWRDGLRDATQSGAESFAQFEIDANTSISEFEEMLRESMLDVMAWRDNLLLIAQRTSPEFATYLAEIGPAAAGLVADLVESGDDIQDTFQTWVGYSEAVNRDFVAEFDQTPAGVQRRMDDIRAAVISTLGPLANDARTQALAISDAIMQGLVDGIANGQPGLAYAAAAMANSVLITTKDTLGIRSPSQVFADEVGAPIAEGVADGITYTAYQAKDAMVAFTDDLTSTALDSVTLFSQSMNDVLKTAEDAFKGAWAVVQGRRGQEQATQRVTDAEQRLEDAQTGVVTATNAVNNAHAELIRVMADSESTARDVETAQRNLTNAQRDLDRANKEVTAATKGLEDANWALLQVSEHLLEQGPESVAQFEEIARAAGLEAGEIQTLVTRYNELTAARQAAAEASRRQAEADREVADIGRRAAVDAANQAVRDARARRDEVARAGGNVAAEERKVAQAAINAANAFAQASGAQAGSRAFAQAQLDVLRFLVAESPWLADDLAGTIRALSSVAALANGAIVTGPTFAMVGEAGAEAVIPLGRPQRAMQLMEQSGLADMARGTAGGLVNIEHATFATPSDADLVAQKVNAAYRARVLVS